MSMIVPHEHKTDGKWQDLKTLGPLPQQVDCNWCPVSPASHFYGSSCWKTWQPPEPGQHDNKKNCKLIHSECHPRALEPIRIQALDVINDFQLATLRIQSCKSSQSTSCRKTHLFTRTRFGLPNNEAIQCSCAHLRDSIHRGHEIWRKRAPNFISTKD